MSIEFENIGTEEVQRLQANLLSRTSELLMLPEVATEALELARDENCRTAELACLVEKDIKLASEILRLVNSPVFAGSSPIMDLKHAIVRIGLKQCRNLIVTTSAASLMKSLPLEQEWFKEVFWSHSFVTATACVHLNRSLNLGFHGEEFAGGLLHDLGRMLLAVADPELYSQADDLSFDETHESLDHERGILGVDHCEFGAWFATLQGLPSQLVEVIAHHHHPDQGDLKNPLVALVAAADHIANHIQRFEEVECYDPAENRWIQLLEEIYNAPLQEQFTCISETLLTEVVSDSDLNNKSCKLAGSEDSQ